MCGVFASLTTKPMSKKTLNEIHQYQAHRGPDGFGEHFIQVNAETHVSLLHQRLAIIDKAGGSQPYVSICGDYIISFNGEIFNYLDLRKNLEDHGINFKTKGSDTEVLLYMYIVHGTQMFKYLRGMWAFVIYDNRRRVIFCARDNYGIKPLYYTVKKNEIFISSELKTLKKIGLADDLDKQSIVNYLAFQCVPNPNTIYENIYKVRPGTCLEIDVSGKSIKTSRYWKLEFGNQKFTQDEFYERLDEKIKDAVKTWCVSDVEVCNTLSGGLDSSLIAVLMKCGLGNSSLKTFTLGFKESFRDLDETETATSLASEFGFNHHNIMLSEECFIRNLNNMVYHLDEPYGGGLPSWFVFKEISKHAKVTLTGIGGDELFGNYNKSRVYRLSILKQLNRLRVNAGSHTKDAVRNFIKLKSGFLFPKYFKGHAIQHLVSTEGTKLPEQFIEELFLESQSANFENKTAYTDFNLQLTDEFLHMADRFSMAHSVEARTPFLDQNLVNFVYSTDLEMRFSFKDPKFALRQVADNYLPTWFLSNKKQGFVLPETHWIRTILREEIEWLLGTQYLKDQGIFSPQVYSDYVLPHMKETRDYTWQIWTIYMFQKWFQTGIEHEYS